MSELYVYSLAQPVLNVFFGFLFGLAIFTNESLPWRRLAWYAWGGLLVFVSVRVVGDWLFQQPHLPYETLRLYMYATCFFFGIAIAGYLRTLYGTEAG